MDKEIIKILEKTFWKENDTPKTVEELLSLISKTVDSVIGEDEENAPDESGNFSWLIEGKNALRKEQREKLKQLLGNTTD